MSSVLARYRKISEMEFYHSAKVVRHKCNRFLMNDKYVPKRWRPVYTFPVFNLLDELFSCIIEANEIYPYTVELVDRRKELQRKAIATCEKIFDKLQDLIETLYYSEVDADNPLPGELIEIGDALDRTEGLLKAWKKKTKLVNYKASPSDEQ